jgi:hypothetical protein
MKGGMEKVTQKAWLAKKFRYYHGLWQLELLMIRFYPNELIKKRKPKAKPCKKFRITPEPSLIPDCIAFREPGGKYLIKKSIISKSEILG